MKLSLKCDDVEFNYSILRKLINNFKESRELYLKENRHHSCVVNRDKKCMIHDTIQQPKYQNILSLD